MTNTKGKRGSNDRFSFLGTPKSLWMVTAAMKLKDASYKESYDKPRQRIQKQVIHVDVWLETNTIFESNYPSIKNKLIKKRDVTLPTKIHMVKPMVFSVVMDRCESWTIKKAESQRTGAFILC